MLNFHQKQVEILKNFAETLVKCFARKTARIPRQDSQKSIPVIKENTESVTEVKEILDIVPNSSNTTTKNSKHNEVTGKAVFSPFKFCIQLICFRINLTLYNEERNKKFVFSIDDIIYSLDKQSFYSKVKVKVDKVSGIFYECDDGENWVKNNILEINGLESMEKNETFMIVTITKAGTKNVRKYNQKSYLIFYIKSLLFYQDMRWEHIKRNRPLNKYLGEVDATIQQIDLFLNFEAMSNFLPLINTINPGDKRSPGG